MKSAMQMKSKPMAWMKLNPPIRRRAGFHPRRGFHRRRRFIPPARVDLVEKDSDCITIRVFFWQRMRDSNPRERSQSPVCYRYTNPLCVRHGYYYTQRRKNVKNFFPFLTLFSFLFYHARKTSLYSCSHGKGFPFNTLSRKYKKVSFSPFSFSMVKINPNS